LGRYTLDRELYLAWATGYIDGEGWICLKNKSTRIVSVKSVCPYSLWRLQALFGGSVKCVKYEPKRRNNLMPATCFIFVWSVYGDTAAAVCKELDEMGLLSVKPAQAKAVAYGKQTVGTAKHKRLRTEAWQERYRRYNNDGNSRW